jgi:hypothetical protein
MGKAWPVFSALAESGFLGASVVSPLPGDGIDGEDANGQDSADSDDA